MYWVQIYKFCILCITSILVYLAPKKQTQRQTKVFNENPPYSLIWPYSFNWHLRVGCKKKKIWNGCAKIRVKNNYTLGCEKKKEFEKSKTLNFDTVALEFGGKTITLYRSDNFKMSSWSENFFQKTNEIISGFLPWNFFVAFRGLPGSFLGFWGT